MKILIISPSQNITKNTSLPRPSIIPKPSKIQNLHQNMHGKIKKNSKKKQLFECICMKISKYVYLQRRPHVLDAIVVLHAYYPIQCSYGFRLTPCVPFTNLYYQFKGSFTST